MGAGGGGGVVDGGGFAVAGDVVLQYLPRAFQVVGVFEAIGPGGLSAAEGLPVSVGNSIRISVSVLLSLLLIRQSDSSGSAEGRSYVSWVPSHCRINNTQETGGIVRVGAAGALSEAEWVEAGEECLRVGDAVAVAVGERGDGCGVGALSGAERVEGAVTLRVRLVAE